MKTITKCLCLAMLFVSFLPNLAHSKNIWRDCGIGAMIFDETKWAASTSNVIFDLGLTASTSYSSSQSQCAGKGASTGNFIYQNYAILEEETTAGEGTYLVSMLDTLGCEAATHHDIIKSLRDKFGKNILSYDYTSKSDLDKAQSYYDLLIDVVQNNFGKQCAVI